MFYIFQFVYRLKERNVDKLETTESLLSYTFNVYLKIFWFSYLGLGSSSYLTLLI